MDRQETCEIPLASTGAARRALERRLNKCSGPDKLPPGLSGALRRTRRPSRPGSVECTNTQNMVTVRHIALNLLRGAKDKHSLKTRRKSARWNTDYLETIIR